MSDPFSDYNLMAVNCGKIERGDARAIRVSAEHYLWLCSARSTVAAITQTAGGEVEGRPTSVINILQRIRKLVETERAHAHSSTVAWRWRWTPNDFWKYTDENGPAIPATAQFVEALAVHRPKDGASAFTPALCTPTENKGE